MTRERPESVSMPGDGPPAPVGTPQVRPVDGRGHGEDPNQAIRSLLRQARGEPDPETDPEPAAIETPDLNDDIRAVLARRQQGA